LTAAPTTATTIESKATMGHYTRASQSRRRRMEARSKRKNSGRLPGSAAQTEREKREENPTRRALNNACYRNNGNNAGSQSCGDFHSHIAEMPSDKGGGLVKGTAGHGWSRLSTTPTCSTRPPAKLPVIYDPRAPISLIAFRFSIFRFPSCAIFKHSDRTPESNVLLILYSYTQRVLRIYNNNPKANFSYKVQSDFTFPVNFILKI